MKRLKNCDVAITPETLAARRAYRAWRQTRVARPDPSHPDWGLWTLQSGPAYSLESERRNAMGTRDRRRKRTEKVQQNPGS